MCQHHDTLCETNYDVTGDVLDVARMSVIFSHPQKSCLELWAFGAAIMLLLQSI